MQSLQCTFFFSIVMTEMSRLSYGTPVGHHLAEHRYLRARGFAHRPHGMGLAL